MCVCLSIYLSIHLFVCLFVFCCSPCFSPSRKLSWKPTHSVMYSCSWSFHYSPMKYKYYSGPKEFGSLSNNQCVWFHARGENGRDGTTCWCLGSSPFKLSLVQFLPSFQSFSLIPASALVSITSLVDKQKYFLP